MFNPRAWRFWALPSRAGLAFSRNESETTASITSQQRHPVARLLSLRNTDYMLSGFNLKKGISRSPDSISALRRAIHISILTAIALCSVIICASHASAAQTTPAQQAAQAITPNNSSDATAPIIQYTLSPEKTRQAQALA